MQLYYWTMVLFIFFFSFLSNLVLITSASFSFYLRRVYCLCCLDLELAGWGAYNQSNGMVGLVELGLFSFIRVRVRFCIYSGWDENGLGWLAVLGVFYFIFFICTCTFLSVF